jgi:hypothetical protein
MLHSLRAIRDVIKSQLLLFDDANLIVCTEVITSEANMTLSYRRLGLASGRRHCLEESLGQASPPPVPPPRW